MMPLVQLKIISVNFSKAKTKFCLNLHYNCLNTYLHVNKTEICKFKLHHNIRWYKFSLGMLSKDFTKDEQSDVCLNGTVYSFLVDLSLVEKEDMLTIHECLMFKNNINANIMLA